MDNVQTEWNLNMNEIAKEIKLLLWCDVPMENTEKQVNVFSFSPAPSTTSPDGIEDKDSTVVLIYPFQNQFTYIC